jgi:hypothetical protein
VPRLIKEALDLDTPAADAVRFEPVKLRLPDAPGLEEPYERDSFELPPPTFAIASAYLAKSPDSISDSDDFDLGDLARDLEVHVEE